MKDKHQESSIDPYETLGVESEATSAQARAAYLQKVREHPPERDPEGFKRIREAYELLRSPRKRAEMTLLQLRSGPAEFDLGRLHDAPPPPFPNLYLEHLLSVVLADVDAAIDAEVALAQERLAPAVGRDDRGGSKC